MASRGFLVRRSNQGQRRTSRGMIPVQVRVLSPWEGFTPDTSYHALAPSGTTGWRALMISGEFLQTRDGFEQLIDNTGTVQFGGDPDNFGYLETLGVSAWQRGVRTPATGPNGSNNQPIGAIGFFFNDRGGTGNANRQDAFVITHTNTRPAAGTGVVPWSETNGFFVRRLDVVDTWADVLFLDAPVAPFTPASIDSPPRFSTSEVIDWAIFPIDIPTIVNYSRAGWATPGSTPSRPYVLWCAQDPGPGNTIVTDGGHTVMVYPWAIQGTHGIDPLTDKFTSMAVIGNQLTQNLGAGGVDQGADVATGIGARSLTVFDGRALYLNTTENLGLVRRPRRVRWSIIGDPFILDQGYQESTGSAINGVGAGFMDLTEFQGDGVKIEVMGRTAVACYMSDGVAFLRSTGRPTEAFEREIISKTRGLIGTRALVNIGQGLHFGIFTDGWYFLDESGRWQEVGLSKGVREDQNTYKWKEHFYQQLVQQQAYKTTVAYDALRKFIQICWCSADEPAGGATDEVNTVWYYDIQSDRVYEDTYVEDYADDMTPRAWGVSPPTIHQSASAAYVERANERIVLHGDSVGRVYAHDVQIHQYNGQNIAWDFELKESAFGLDPFTSKTIDRMWIEYEVLNAFPCAVLRVQVVPDSGTVVERTVALQSGLSPEGDRIRVAQVAFRGTADDPVDGAKLGLDAGHRFQIQFESEAPHGNISIVSIRLQVIVGEDRGLGSSVHESGGTDI